MSYLKFDKNQLVNLEYSLQREIIRSNRAGSYCCTTLSGCNTRKYHGMLVCPIEEIDGDKHILLSSLDETVIQHGAEFNLGIHKYTGEQYEPKGHKYIRNFSAEIIPVTTYRVGGVILTKERMLIEQSEQILTRYTLVEANSPTTLRFKPFLAFRNVHKLSKANMDANTKFTSIANGITICMYQGYPNLYMQLSKTADFIAVPDWYNNIEYFKEKNRGYDCVEDLYVPGYFEVPIKKGESIVFSASTEIANPQQLKRKFSLELKKRTPRTSFFNSLKNSAQQFVVKTDKKADIQAGYPWYNGRIVQTFVALPGLSLAFDDKKLAGQILDTNLKRLNNGLFPKRWGRNSSEYDTSDASLWFFWTVQKLDNLLGSKKTIWDNYKKAFKEILTAYRNGSNEGIGMRDDGLICASRYGTSLSWMDAFTNGMPVTPRYGCTVELNALWYNAICYALELAEVAGDTNFIEEWKDLPTLIAISFVGGFWDIEKAYLADVLQDGEPDWSIRPNMVIAVAMPYSPLDKEMKKAILSLAKNDLLTPRGLRTLSPRFPAYKGSYEGNEFNRESAAHQGSVHPWLIGFFIEAYLNIHKKGGLSFVKRIMDGFEEEMANHCIGTISEVYNGNPPHIGKGSISQAWNVAEILRAMKTIEKYQN